MKQISKDIVLAAVVRSFFKYFVTGIIESQHGTDIQNGFEPINVKKTMLNTMSTFRAISIARHSLA